MALGLTTLPPSYAHCLEIRNLNLLEPSGPGPVLGLLYLKQQNEKIFVKKEAG